MVKRILASMIILFFAGALPAAYEEPVKTLKEKREREEFRARIAGAGVKKITAYKYEIVDRKETGKSWIVIAQEFDEKGSLAKVETFKDGKPDRSVKFLYDQEMNLMEETVSGPDGKAVSRTVFSYDKDGRVLSLETFGPAGQKTESLRYEHSADRKKIISRHYNEQGALKFTTEHLYAGDFDATACYEMDRFNDQGALVSRLEQQIGDKGLVYAKLIYDKDGKVTGRFNYEYDKEGNNTKVVKVSPDGSTPEFSQVFELDKKGICKEIKNINSQGRTTTIIRHKFEYSGK